MESTIKIILFLNFIETHTEFSIFFHGPWAFDNIPPLDAS